MGKLPIIWPDEEPSEKEMKEVKALQIPLGTKLKDLADFLVGGKERRGDDAIESLLERGRSYGIKGHSLVAIVRYFKSQGRNFFEEIRKNGRAGSYSADDIISLSND